MVCGRVVALWLGLATAAATPCLLPPPPHQQQGTTAGCTCVSDCGASIEDGYAFDWCYTNDGCGTYSYTRLAYYDWCLYKMDTAYESQPAAAKEKYLWTLSAKCTQPADWASQAGIFTESVKTSFEDISDLMPPARFKYIHTVGAVATVKFEASSAPHPFTGLFATGASHGLLRLSTATPVDASAGSSITPGLALKLLRNGTPSANLLAMPSLDGQTDFDVLSLNYSNHLVYPTSWALNMVAQKFTQASSCPLMVGLGHVAAFEEDGTQVAHPQMPFEVIFVPNKEIKAFPSAPFSNDDFLAYAELGIEEGTPLFEVYGRASPRADDITDVFLGTLKTTSKMTRSTFGDTQLFFQHEFMENDFSKHPEWLQALDLEAACGSADVKPAPPDTALAHAARSNRRSSHKCPFASARDVGASHSAGRLSDDADKAKDGCPYLLARARQKELEAQNQRAQSAVS